MTHNENNKDKKTYTEFGVMHMIMHKFGDWEIETRHMSRIEKSIYLDMRAIYLKTGESLTSDIDMLSRRLSCRTNSEKKALAFLLKDKFVLDKRTKRYKHLQWEVILKNYKYKNPNKHVTNNMSENNNMTDDVTSKRPSTDAERQAKSRNKAKKIRTELSNIGIDTKANESINELIKLHDIHKDKIKLSLNKNNVTSCHAECHTHVTQEKAITSSHKQETETVNKQPIERERDSRHLSEAPSEPEVVNEIPPAADCETQPIKAHASQVAKVQSQQLGSIENWQAPEQHIILEKLNHKGTVISMTDEEFEIHVEEFKVYYCAQEHIGKSLVTESHRIMKLYQWIERAFSSQNQTNAKKDYRNPNNSSYPYSSSEKPVYHASHTHSESNIKKDDKVNAFYAGFWREPLPGKTLDETLELVNQCRRAGEGAHETHDRLLKNIEMA